jgi:hypothetical protein
MLTLMSAIFSLLSFRFRSRADLELEVVLQLLWTDPDILSAHDW